MLQDTIVAIEHQADGKFSRDDAALVSTTFRDALAKGYDGSAVGSEESGEGVLEKWGSEVTVGGDRRPVSFVSDDVEVPGRARVRGDEGSV